ncbi:molybdopterin biosynthesis protein MoeB [Pseudomonas aeruginosa]|nr:molybdopterin biosynthesis protein MoeB [Pseudomonas aeruginosa]
MKTVIFPEVLVRAAQLEGGRLEGAGLTVGELLAGLARKHPSLLGHLYYENGQLKEHFLLTHKGSLVNLDGELSDGDEVEVMLATSGGSGVEALSDEEVQRYVRHITLPGVGREGQQRLKQARVLIIGTGGLGSPACLYLAAAGVGTIGLVDFDVVESSNLQRQVVHGYSTLGMPKVESAQRRMQDLNPYIEVVTHRYAIDADNAQSLIQSYDLVLGWHRQLRHTLLGQRGLRQARKTTRLWRDLSVRRSGQRLQSGGRPLLPMSLPEQSPA